MKDAGILATTARDCDSVGPSPSTAELLVTTMTYSPQILKYLVPDLYHIKHVDPLSREVLSNSLC